jgi:hypothetical protein
MEVDHDTRVQSDAFRRLAVVVVCTSSTLKEVGHACTGGDLSKAHHSFYMTQGGALRRGQAGKVKIVWLHVDSPVDRTDR